MSAFGARGTARLVIIRTGVKDPGNIAGDAINKGRGKAAEAQAYDSDYTV